MRMTSPWKGSRIVSPTLLLLRAAPGVREIGDLLLRLGFVDQLGVDTPHDDAEANRRAHVAPVAGRDLEGELLLDLRAGDDFHVSGIDVDEEQALRFRLADDLAVQHDLGLDRAAQRR